MQNFETLQGERIQEIRAEAASKIHLPKQHLPTDKHRAARYCGMKENSKHIPNKIEQNCNNQKSSLNDLRWRGGRWPQRTWTNTREKVARIARICMLPHIKRRTNVNPEKPFSRTQIPRTHVLQTLADPEAAHKVKVRFCQFEKSQMLSYPLSL